MQHHLLQDLVHLPDTKAKRSPNPVTPQSESVSEEDSDPEQAQRDKDMQKNLALFAKYFKKLYKPTNNNLRTSSNSRNKTEDTTPRYNNDNQSGQFGNQRTMTVAGTRETRHNKRLMNMNRKHINNLMAKESGGTYQIESSSTEQTIATEQNNDDNNAFWANERQHSEILLQNVLISGAALKLI
ncbi:hypothetical protein Tco_0237307 [Tanacetum coccineum]